MCLGGVPPWRRRTPLYGLGARMLGMSVRRYVHARARPHHENARVFTLRPGGRGTGQARPLRRLSGGRRGTGQARPLRRLSGGRRGTGQARPLRRGFEHRHEILELLAVAVVDGHQVPVRPRARGISVLPGTGRFAADRRVGARRAAVPGRCGRCRRIPSSLAIA